MCILKRVTAGYSGSDLTSLAKDAALGPIRGKDVLGYIYIYILPFYHHYHFVLKRAVKNIEQKQHVFHTELGPEQVKSVAISEVRCLIIHVHVWLHM